MDTWWERALPGQYPLVAYRCMRSQLPEFRQKLTAKGNSKANAQMTLLRESDANSGTETDMTETGKWQAYVLRLPYTETMLDRLYQRGPEDCPDWYLWERIPHAFNRAV